ncbi:Opsin-1 [Vanrija pseudolonga]|uniref:Opsin-1 n=1 Tax=Vanrija pseudolonga TaxID=143232 RepID=A0AAF0XZL7_9TREE|nr:Opsin-1 [Vanrija pseudolonga]
MYGDPVITVDPPGGGHPAPTATYPVPTTVPTHFVFDHATQKSVIALWVFFGVFAGGLVGVAVLASRVERRFRIFHTLSSLALAAVTIAYFALATGLGSTHGRYHGNSFSTSAFGKGGGHHGGEPHRPGGPPAVDYIIRQVFWGSQTVRLFSTPLLVIELALLSGLAPLAALAAITYDVLVESSALITATFPGHWRGRVRGPWAGWFAFTSVWTVALFVTLFIPGVNATRHRPAAVKGQYYLLTVLLFVATIAAGIVFTLGNGLNVISVDAEVISTGVIDVITYLGFTYFLLLVHVHGEDDTWEFPAWFVEHRVGIRLDGAEPEAT